MLKDLYRLSEQALIAKRQARSGHNGRMQPQLKFR
jgi:hypothetical protein